MKNTPRSRAVDGLLFASLWLGSVSVAAGAGASGATPVTDLLLRLLVAAVGMAGALLSFRSALSALRSEESEEGMIPAPVRVAMPAAPRRRTRR